MGDIPASSRIRGKTTCNDTLTEKCLMILIISIIGGYALGIYVGRNWDKYTTE